MRKHHKKDSLFLGRILRESSFGGSSPRDNSVKGRSLDGNLPFSLMSKGKRLIICMERESYTWRESIEA
jgi:hypothetical protein